MAQSDRVTPTGFQTVRLAEEADYLAPDGSEVRPLARVRAGSLAHFRLPADATSGAVAHRTVEEIWYVVSGRGEMWRKQGHQEEVVELRPGVSLTLPAETHFQFRAHGRSPLEVIAATMPPWPGSGEAYPVEGRWPPSRSSDHP